MPLVRRGHRQAGLQNWAESRRWRELEQGCVCTSAAPPGFPESQGEPGPRLPIRGQKRCGGRLQIFQFLPQNPLQSWEIRLKQLFNKWSCILQEFRLQFFELPSGFNQFNSQIPKGAVVVRVRIGGVQVHQSRNLVGIAGSNRTELLARQELPTNTGRWTFKAETTASTSSPSWSAE